MQRYGGIDSDDSFTIVWRPGSANSYGLAVCAGGHDAFVPGDNPLPTTRCASKARSLVNRMAFSKPRATVQQGRQSASFTAALISRPLPSTYVLVPAEFFKTKRRHVMMINNVAWAIVQRRRGVDRKFVFTYQPWSRRPCSPRHTAV